MGDGPRFHGLERLTGVEVAIGTAVLLPLAAKVEISRRRIANGPAAIVREQRFDCLFLGVRDVRIGTDARGRWSA